MTQNETRPPLASIAEALVAAGRRPPASLPPAADGPKDAEPLPEPCHVVEAALSQEDR